MKPAEVRAQIAAGRTGSLYLLEGDDLQSRHDLALEFAGLVDEGLQAFNVESFYANEASTAGARDQMIATLLAAARTFPMMAPRRVMWFTKRSACCHQSARGRTRPRTRHRSPPGASGRRHPSPRPKSSRRTSKRPNR